MKRNVLKSMALFGMCLTMTITSIDFSGLNLDIGSIRAKAATEFKNVAFEDTDSWHYTGNCPGIYTISSALAWYEVVGRTSGGEKAFVEVGGHGSDSVITTHKPKENSSYGENTINHKYNVEQYVGGKEYVVGAYIWCKYPCKAGDLEFMKEFDPIEGVYYHGSGYVTREGSFNSNCNVCGKPFKSNGCPESANIQKGAGACSVNPNGNHLFHYHNDRGYCFYCKAPKPSASKSGIACDHGHNVDVRVDLKWKTKTYGDSPENSPSDNPRVKFTHDVKGAGDYREVIMYGGDVDLTFSLINVGNSEYLIGTEAYWTKNEDTNPIAGVGGKGDDGDTINYAGPIYTNGNRGGDGQHDFTLQLRNVTESNNYYQFHWKVKKKGGDYIEYVSPRLYVDTTIVYFDYSPSDGVVNNELLYKNGNLIDNTGTLHIRDIKKGYADGYRRMVQARALIPDKTYEYESDNKSTVLPKPLLYFRYNLFPRTIKTASGGYISTGSDSSTAIVNNNYSVFMPYNFIDHVYELAGDLAQDTPSGLNKETAITSNNTSVSGDKFNELSDYGTGWLSTDALVPSGISTKNDAINYDPSNTSNIGETRYTLYNTIDFKRWVLSNRELVTTKGAHAGDTVSDKVTPDGLKVIGLHWAIAEYDWNQNKSNLDPKYSGTASEINDYNTDNKAELQLPRPERYVAILLYDSDGTPIANDDIVDGTLKAESTQYNDRVTGKSFTVDDFNNGVQLAKGGTYSYKAPTNHILGSYSGTNYLTYRYEFGGWYANKGGVTPIYHVHTGNSKEEGGCYTTPIYHTHTSDCYTSTEHKHTLSCYMDIVYHKHKGDTIAGGDCYSPIYHQHAYIIDNPDTAAANHTHTDSCYRVEETVFICGMETHHHNNACRDEDNNLVCGFAYEHSHTDDCREDVKVLTCSFKDKNTDKTILVYTTDTSLKLKVGEGGNTGCFTEPHYHVHDASCKNGDEKADKDGNKCGLKESTEGKTDGDIDYYTFKCEHTGEKIGYELTCTKRLYADDLTIDEVDSHGDLICGMEEGEPDILADTKLICGKAEGDLDGYLQDCSMHAVDEPEPTIVGYEQATDGTYALYNASDGFVREYSNLDLYADWKEIDLELPQLYKPGYEFLGWFTTPQEVTNNRSGNDGSYDGDTSSDAVFDNTVGDGEDYLESGNGNKYNDVVTYDEWEKLWAGGGYNPTLYGTDGYERDRTFREEVVNMDNSSNCVKLYAWFNRRPIYSDLYEGLFFEGQDVSYEDLTRLVGVFDYEDDYYNEAVKKIYNLPEVNLDDIYLEVVEDTDNNWSASCECFKEGEGIYEKEGCECITIEVVHDDNNCDCSECSCPEDLKATSGCGCYVEAVVHNSAKCTCVENFDSEDKNVDEPEAYPDDEGEFDRYRNGTRYFDYARWKMVDTLDIGNESDSADEIFIIKNGYIKFLKDVTSKVGEDTVTYKKDQLVDGVYELIDENDENYGKYFYTLEAKIALEACARGTSLDLRIKDIKYVNEDNKTFGKIVTVEDFDTDAWAYFPVEAQFIDSFGKRFTSVEDMIEEVLTTINSSSAVVSKLYASVAKLGNTIYFEGEDVYEAPEYSPVFADYKFNYDDINESFWTTEGAKDLDDLAVHKNIVGSSPQLSVFSPLFALDTSTKYLHDNYKSDDPYLYGGDDYYTYFDVTYIVTDDGILCGSDIITDSAITLEYTRRCRLEYNDAPIIYVENMIMDNHLWNVNTSDVLNDTFEAGRGNALDSLDRYIKERQIVIDAQDTQSNVPWWHKKVSRDHLLDSLEITGVWDIKVSEALLREVPDAEDYLNTKYSLYPHRAGVSEGDGTGWSSQKRDDPENGYKLYVAFFNDMRHASSRRKGDDATDWIEDLRDIYNEPVSAYRLWQSITSVQVDMDAHDQFGKYASGRVTDYAQTEGLHVVDGIEDDDDHSDPSDPNDPTSKNKRRRQGKKHRSVTITLIDKGSDPELINANIKSYVRYIDNEWLNGEGKIYTYRGHGTYSYITKNTSNDNSLHDKVREGTISYWGSTGYGYEILQNVFIIRDYVKMTGDKSGAERRIYIKDENGYPIIENGSIVYQNKWVDATHSTGSYSSRGGYSVNIEVNDFTNE